MASNELIVAGEGYPLTTDTLKQLNNASIVNNALVTAIAGDFVILKGCEVVGNTRKEGLISVKGQAIPYVGGSADAYLEIVTETKQDVYNESGLKDVYKVIYARSTSANTSVLWSTMVKIHDLLGVHKELEAYKKVKEDVGSILNNRVIASGSVKKLSFVDGAFFEINLEFASEDTKYAVIAYPSFASNNENGVNNSTSIHVRSCCMEKHKNRCVIRLSTDAKVSSVTPKFDIDWVIVKM